MGFEHGIHADKFSLRITVITESVLRNLDERIGIELHKSCDAAAVVIMAVG